MAQAKVQGGIEIVAAGDRQEAVRMHLEHVLVGFRMTKDVGTFGVATADGGEAVQGGPGQVPFTVQPAVKALGVRITDPVRELTGECQVGVGLRNERRNPVGAGAVGGVSIDRLHAPAQPSALQAVAHVEPRGLGLAIGNGAVLRVDAGVVCANADTGTTADAAAVEHDIDDTSDRIRAVLGTGTVAQDLDPGHCAQGDGVEVEGIGAAADLGVVVDHGRDMGALTVDQHQQLVGIEPA